MGAPFEIINGPVEIYKAVIGATRPKIDAVPDSNIWTKIGASGNLNYTRDGVKVTLNVKSFKARADGDLGARKIFYTETDLSTEVTLMDLGPEAIALVLNGSVEDVPPAGADAGYKWVGLSVVGSEPAQRSLLIRGVSTLAESAGLYAQWWLPVTVQIGEPTINYKREAVADVKLMFDSLVHQAAATPAERFGRYEVGDLPAGT